MANEEAQRQGKERDKTEPTDGRRLLHSPVTLIVPWFDRSEKKIEEKERPDE